MIISVINGPYLYMLGKRESDIYGKETLADIEELCTQHAKKHNFIIEFSQYNSEAAIIETIQQIK